MLNEQQYNRLEDLSARLGKRIVEVPDINAAGVKASTREFLERRPALLAYDDTGNNTIYVFSERITDGSVEHIDNVIACEVLAKEGPKGLLKGNTLYEWNRDIADSISGGLKFAIRAYHDGGKLPDAAVVREFLMMDAVRHDRFELHAPTLKRAATAVLNLTDLGLDKESRENQVGFTSALEQYYASEKIREIRRMGPADINERLVHHMEVFFKTNKKISALIPFGEVSPALRTAGINGDALFMSTKSLWMKASKHEMDEANLGYYRLAESIRNPLAVFSSYSSTNGKKNAADRFVVLTDIPTMSETGEYPTFLAAVVEANAEKMMNRAQLIFSFHPVSNLGVVNQVFNKITESNMDNKILYLRDDFEERWLKGLPRRLETETDKRKERRPRINEKNRGVQRAGFDCPSHPETTVSIAKIVKNWKNKHADELFLMRQPHDDEYVTPKFEISDDASILVRRDERRTESQARVLTPKTELVRNDFKAEKTFKTVSALGIRTVKDLLTKRDIVLGQVPQTVGKEIDALIRAAGLQLDKKQTAEEKETAELRNRHLGGMIRTAFPSEQSAAQIKYNSDGIVVLVFGNRHNAMNLKGERLLKEHVDWIAPPKEGFARIMKRKAGEIKYNFVDADGKVLLKNWVDKASDFRNGQAIVEIGSKKKVVDTSGRVTADEDINAGQSKGHPGP